MKKSFFFENDLYANIFVKYFKIQFYERIFAIRLFAFDCTVWAGY